MVDLAPGGSFRGTSIRISTSAVSFVSVKSNSFIASIAALESIPVRFLNCATEVSLLKDNPSE